jgi:hypothetical protein
MYIQLIGGISNERSGKKEHLQKVIGYGTYQNGS